MDVGSSVWTSGTGTGSTVDWTWTGGVEDGIAFSSGASAINNMYENWAAGEPNSTSTNFTRIREGTGDWTDRSGTDTFHYVIEWDAGLMLDDNAIDTLNGGIDNDHLYGYGGDDILQGGDGNDTIFAHDGDDNIDGGDGDDVLYGDEVDQAITEGLVAYYKLDESLGTTVTDYSGNGNTGTYVGGTPTWNPTGGQINGSINMPTPAADDAIEIGTFDVNGTGITLAAWVYYDSTANDARIISKTNGTSANQHDWALYVKENASDSEDRIQLRLTTVNGFAEEALEGYDFSQHLDTWAHLAVTYDDTSDLVTYYVNGVNVGTDAHNAGGTVITGTGETVAIGNNPISVSGTRQWDGEFDEVRIYERELSAAEIEELYSDVTEGGNDIINGGDGDDTILGGGGDDIISGGTGHNLLNGNDGSDMIISDSTATIDADVAAILAANSGVVYSVASNSFYQYISAGTNWTASDTAASAATLTGLGAVTGHLVTITSQTENDFIGTLVGANRIWTAGSDATTEGEWFWLRGPEAGKQFWTGGAAGSASDGMYANWTPGDPSNSNAFMGLCGTFSK